MLIMTLSADEHVHGNGQIAQPVPLEAQSGGRAEATVQHEMRGFIEQAVQHVHEGSHPMVLEVREGDILLLPSHTGTDFSSTSAEQRQIAEDLGAHAVYMSRRISAPFILRKADDE